MRVMSAQAYFENTAAENPIVSHRFVFGLAVLGMLLSGFLFALSLATANTPPGCGPGSACNVVLSSRWSSLLGIPISALAMAACLSTMGLALLPHYLKQPAAHVLSGALASAACWFVALQILVLKAFCPYCMLSHLISLALAALLLRPYKRSRPPRLVASWLLGIAATTVVATIQLLSPAPDPAVFLEPQQGDHDTIAATKARSLTVLGGRLTVSMDQAWVIGDPAAATPIVVLFDHACPHCRTTHTAIQQTIAQAPSICAVLLPIPISTRCNEKGVGDDDAGGRFADSCRRCQLAVAVRLAGGNQAADAYNHWLLSSTPIASADEAHQKAVELVGGKALQQALAEPFISEVFNTPIQTYVAHDALDRLPVVASPGRPTTGQLEHPRAVKQWLDMKSD